MASCCGSNRTTLPDRLKLSCPSCDGKGRTVNNITVRSLLAANKIESLGDGVYNLCLNESCDTSYYNENQSFLRDDCVVPIRKKTYKQKKLNNDPTLVCYCHNVSDHDVVQEMRKNIHARKLSDIQEIFNLNSCSCEEHHPLGGSCACAKDITNSIKVGLVDEKVIQLHRRLEGMLKIDIYEKKDNCCVESDANVITSFLKRKFSDTVAVSSYDLAKDEGVPVTRELIDTFEKEGAEVFPLLLINGEIIEKGSLPNMMQMSKLISNLS